MGDISWGYLCVCVLLQLHAVPYGVSIAERTMNAIDIA